MKHGESLRGPNYSREYVAWAGMIQRCEDPHHISYSRYGGRGIRVCDKWRRDYRVFLADVGRKPTLEYQLDRIDSNKNYEPGNVRWATPREQSNNRRDNRRFEFGGLSLTMPEWARRIGISSSTLWKRLRMRWSIEKVLTTPLRPWKGARAEAK